MKLLMRGFARLGYGPGPIQRPPAPWIRLRAASAQSAFPLGRARPDDMAVGSGLALQAGRAVWNRWPPLTRLGSHPKER